MYENAVNGIYGPYTAWRSVYVVGTTPDST